jgi:hypothetical protein
MATLYRLLLEGILYLCSVSKLAYVIQKDNGYNCVPQSKQSTRLSNQSSELANWRPLARQRMLLSTPK